MRNIARSIDIPHRPEKEFHPVDPDTSWLVHEHRRPVRASGDAVPERARRFPAPAGAIRDPPAPDADEDADAASTGVLAVACPDRIPAPRDQSPATVEGTRPSGTAAG